MRTSQRMMKVSRWRGGTTAVETAFLLPILLFILFMTIDFSLIVLSNNSLSEAARKLARTASVRGENAAPRQTVWGPATYQNDATDESEIAEVVRKSTVCLKPELVDISVEWPDASNRINDRVCVSLEYHHTPLLRIAGMSYVLHATSDVRIRH